MTTRVFLSHSGADWETVHQVATRVASLGLGLTGWDLSGQERLFGSTVQQLQVAAVTMILVTPGSADSEEVRRDVALSIENGKGLLGLRLDPSSVIPDALVEAGAEILDWKNPDDLEYLPHGIAVAEKGAKLLVAAAKRGSGSGAACARPTP